MKLTMHNYTMNYFTINASALFLAVIFLGGLKATAADKHAAKPPDLIKGGKRDASHDWNLGPTGARGWMFFRSEDLTALSRQILITAVESDSPAKGLLRAGDVLLGVNDKPFADDARKSLGRAITAAEEKEGVLRVLRWRAGQTTNVALKLQVLGAYSDTAPYNCPKSKKIFEQGCQLIAKRGLEEADIANDLNALALLASGNKTYHPLLAEYAKKVAASLQPDTWTWYYGYGNMFLAEYVLATGDQAILQELKRTSMETTTSQGAIGTWGHEYYITASGNLNGYGCMNQPGLAVTLSLVLARQAGVKDPAVQQAITKSAAFLRYYVNKGAIPYGDHQPWPSHDDNGKCSSAAVLFDLLGDREAASFFSRMATAAYGEREHGHCGNLWNMLWALPGASRNGPLATGAYLKEQSWYYDLARTWKGGFVYQKIEEGDESDSYTEWDLTGSYLLSYGLLYKNLYLTGKQACVVPPLKLKEVNEVMAAGRDVYPVNGKNGYEQRTTEELLADLSSWSPAMRKRSAQALGKRDGALLPTLLKLLASKDSNTRYGACEALACLGPKADGAAPQLCALFHDPDPWMQSLACTAVACLSPEVRKASVDQLLTLAATQNPCDPRGMTHRAVAAALFDPNPDLNQPGILQHSLDGVDRKLLYPAMTSLLQNNDGLTRYGLVPYLDKLTDRDLAALLPAIVEAIKTMAPSDEMFGDAIRVAGLDLLSRLHIREGMDLCVSTIEARWGNDVEKRLEYLKRYGTHAKAFIPQLRKLRPESGEETKFFDKAIAAIEKSKDTPTLVSLKDFINTKTNTL